MKKLLVYLKGYRVESVLAPLFKLIEVLFELLIPLLIKNIIDIGIANNDTSYIIRMCLYIGGLGLLGIIFSVTAQFFAAKASVGFGGKLRFALFSHLGTLSYTEYDTLGTSSMITRITSDVNQIQTGLNLCFRLLLRSPVVVIGSAIMAFTISVKAAIIFVVAIPVLSVFVFGIMLITIPLYKKVQKHLDGVLKKTRENLGGSRVVRAFGLQESEKAEFKEKVDVLNAAQTFVAKISAFMNPITFIVINIAVIALINTGAIEVSTGIITQGAVIALYNYMSQILVELIKFASLIITLTKSVASASRVSDIFDVHSSMIELPKSEQKEGRGGSIEIKNATLRYKNAGADSLENISFSGKCGETIGIIGGTGSGKTSLVNLFPRFYDASSGEVLVGGVNVKDYGLQALRRKIGIVPQTTTLFKGTIRDNIRFGNESASDEEIFSALKTAQALDIVKNKEGGLDYIIEQGGKNLSGGQRQRISIARAIVKRPDILILDDSASALDYATDAKLRKSIREDLSTNEYAPTVVIVSQRTSSIMHADNILVLEDGKMVAQGKHEQLLVSCAVYKEIYDSQFKGGSNS